MSSNTYNRLNQRFRGFLPVAIDLETAGFNAKKDAILEIAANLIEIDKAGNLLPGKLHSYHIQPFASSNLDRDALEFNGIKPHNPFRLAVPEIEALNDLFTHIHTALRIHKCSKAVIVAHNAVFDQSFMQASVKRCNLLNKDPFHSFTLFDTATLGGLAFGQTVFAKALKIAGFDFDEERAHSAKYDAEFTAKLFCHIVNYWKTLGGWPPKNSASVHSIDISKEESIEQ